VPIRGLFHGLKGKSIVFTIFPLQEAIERLYPDKIEERLGLLAYHWEQVGIPARRKF
jgi:hypothetical protein